MLEQDASASGTRADFAATLRAAIDARAVTLSWLRARLAASGNPVSGTTLSYWRSGDRRPEGAQSLAAVEQLESLLDLETGTLLSLIGPSQRVGPIGVPQYPLERARLERAVAETFTALGAPVMDPGRDVSTHAVTEVGADGFVVSRTTRTILQSTSGTITSVPYLDLTPDHPVPAPTFTILAGGRISRLHSHPTGEVHGAMFELERPLGPAQTTMIEWRLDFPPGYPGMRETGHGVARVARDLLLWTRFHPDALPDWIEEVEESPEKTTFSDLHLDGATSLHQVRRNWGPGMLIHRWGYGEREPSADPA